MKTKEDPRVTAYNEYRKERKIEREKEADEREARSEVRKIEAEKRHAVIAQRLKALGLDDLFSTGVHARRWSMDGAEWEIWVAIPKGQSINSSSEQVVNTLLDRLERMLSRK